MNSKYNKIMIYCFLILSCSNIKKEMQGNGEKTLKIIDGLISSFDTNNSVSNDKNIYKKRFQDKNGFINKNELLNLKEKDLENIEDFPLEILRYIINESHNKEVGKRINYPIPKKLVFKFFRKISNHIIEKKRFKDNLANLFTFRELITYLSLDEYIIKNKIITKQLMRKYPIDIKENEEKIKEVRKDLYMEFWDNKDIRKVKTNIFEIIHKKKQEILNKEGYEFIELNLNDKKTYKLAKKNTNQLNKRKKKLLLTIATDKDSHNIECYNSIYTNSFILLLAKLFDIEILIYKNFKQFGTDTILNFRKKGIKFKYFIFVAHGNKDFMSLEEERYFHKSDLIKRAKIFKKLFFNKDGITDKNASVFLNSCYTGKFEDNFSDNLITFFPNGTKLYATTDISSTPYISNISEDKLDLDIGKNLYNTMLKKIVITGSQNGDLSGNKFIQERRKNIKTVFNEKLPIINSNSSLKKVINSLHSKYNFIWQPNFLYYLDKNYIINNPQELPIEFIRMLLIEMNEFYDKSCFFKVDEFKKFIENLKLQINNKAVFEDFSNTKYSSEEAKLFFGSYLNFNERRFEIYKENNNSILFTFLFPIPTIVGSILYYKPKPETGISEWLKKEGYKIETVNKDFKTTFKKLEFINGPNKDKSNILILFPYEGNYSKSIENIEKDTFNKNTSFLTIAKNFNIYMYYCKNLKELLNIKNQIGDNKFKSMLLFGFSDGKNQSINSKPSTEKDYINTILNMIKPPKKDENCILDINHFDKYENNRNCCSKLRNNDPNNKSDNEQLLDFFNNNFCNNAQIILEADNIDLPLSKYICAALPLGSTVSISTYDNNEFIRSENFNFESDCNDNIYFTPLCTECADFWIKREVYTIIPNDTKQKNELLKNEQLFKYGRFKYKNKYNHFLQKKDLVKAGLAQVFN